MLMSLLSNLHVCCSVLQCVAMYCSVNIALPLDKPARVLQCIAVRCSVLQLFWVDLTIVKSVCCRRIAECYRVLQCAALVFRSHSF